MNTVNDSEDGHRADDRSHREATESHARGPQALHPHKSSLTGRAAVPVSRQLATIRSVDELEQRLSDPTELATETLSQIDGDILLLGVGGKMGPTLARMAKRASDLAGVDRRVIGVSRFSNAATRESLQAHGVETIACDLLDPTALASLPAATNVISMTAMKFGSTAREPEMWTVNCCLTARICDKFRDSRIVVFSTGNVYGMTPIHRGGSTESDHPNPVGEYAMSCLGRERVFQYFSEQQKLPCALLRLNYACELRYGVLVDLAQKVWAGQTIDLTMGYLNAIWQGDANAMTLSAFAHVASPPFIINIAGPEQLPVRQVCEQFGRLFDKPVHFHGCEATDALLSNGQQGYQRLGYPRYVAAEMIDAIAGWIQHDGELLGKPTRFESRDGRF